MKQLPWIVCALAVACLPAAALEEDKATRLQALMGLEMEALGEVEVKLDDVFDVFDGLVKQQKVTVASGRAQSTAVAPSVTSVITAQDIEASGARTLAEALRMVPGLHVSVTSNYRPIYLLRGMVNSINPEALFLLNGMPIKNPTSGNLGMFDIVPGVQSIARIEVIRGPGSAVYGADAFSGVINLITKTAQEIDGTEVGLRTGSDDTHEGWALHGERLGEVDIAAAVQVKQTGGLDAIIEQDTQTLIDAAMGQFVPGYRPVSDAPGPLHLGHETLDTHLDLGWRKWQLRLDYTGLMNREVGVYVLTLDPRGNADASRYSADVTWRDPQLAGAWDVQARWSYQRWTETSQLWYNPPGAILQEGYFPQGVYEKSQAEEEVLRFETDVFYRGLAQHVPRFGIGASSEDATQSDFHSNRGLDRFGQPLPAGGPLVDLTGSPYASAGPLNRNRDNWHLFAQDSWTFAPSWEFTAGLRYDDYSDFGQTTNPRAALVWQTTPEFTAKLLYGKAFRAPTFQEMYLYNPLLRGNPTLEPETINSYELAFDWRAREDVYLTLSLYRFDIQDKIVPLLGIADPQFANSGGREGAGMELEARWKIGNRASLLFNYAYADTFVIHHYEEGGDEAANASAESHGTKHRQEDYPRHTAYLRLDWLVQPNWYLDGQTHWAADFARMPGDPRPAMDDNFSVDLTLRYKKARDWDWNFAFGVRNLFDANLREPAQVSVITNDYPLGRRTWFAEIRYKF